VICRTVPLHRTDPLHPTVEHALVCKAGHVISSFYQQEWEAFKIKQNQTQNRFGINARIYSG